jgi:hypothetical protein
VFCVDLRTNNDLFPYTAVTGLYNRDGECLLRGTDGIFLSRSRAKLSIYTFVRRFGWSVAGLSQRRTRFGPRSVCVTFVVDRVALGQVFIPVLRFSPVSIIPSMLHTQLHLHVALTRRTNRRSLGTFRNSSALSAVGERWIEKYSKAEFKGLNIIHLFRNVNLFSIFS